jgi:hypothetical protein
MLQEQQQQLQLVAALMGGYMLPSILQQLYCCVKLLQANVVACNHKILLHMLQQRSLDVGLAAGYLLDELLFPNVARTQCTVQQQEQQYCQQYCQQEQPACSKSATIGFHHS